MNKIFNLIWNKATSSWVVVSEATTSRSARGSVKRGSSIGSGSAARTGVSLTALAAALAYAGCLHAAPLTGVVSPAPKPMASTELPTGGKVAAGQAGITQNNSTLTINQSSQRAVIDWSTFNVGGQAEVRFNQPNSQSATLNRVLDSNPSQIAGRISANGKVYLSNPNGVLFAPGSSVDVGALTATTHSISNADFMEGKESFQRQGATGQVVNEGTLQARLGGYIAMLAPEVRNQGVIVVPMGTVALAAGEAFHLQFNAAGKLTDVRVEPSTLKALVENRHAIVAPGGLVILSARAANELQGGVVRNSGTIEAKGLSSRGGRIVLDGDTVINTGTLDASSSQHQGGTVEIKATTLELGGVVNVSGVVGGQVQVQAAQAAVVQGEVLAMGLATGSGAAETSAHQSGSATNTPPLKLDIDDPGQQGHGGHIDIAAGHSVALNNAQLDASGLRQGGRINVAAQAPAQGPQDAPLPSRPTAPTTVTLSGSSSLRSNSRSGRAGRVVLTGDHLSLDDHSQILANGLTGGGTVLVGGDWQGSNGVYQATSVRMGADASIEANAMEQGDGGTIVLWSDIHRPNTITHAIGTLMAQGGSVSGNGGRIETSGHQLRTEGIRVDTQAANGRTGDWLLDPTSFTIAASGGDITGAAVAANLNTTNVTLLTGATSTNPGHIVINDNIAYTGAAERTLTFKAHNDITLNSGRTISSSNARLNTVFRSRFSTASPDYGSVYLNGNITTNGGGLWVGGGAGDGSWTPYAGASPITVADGIAATWTAGVTGVAIVGSTINTGAGNIQIGGQSFFSGLSIGAVTNRGVLINNASITSTSGNIGVWGDVRGVMSLGAGLGLYATDGNVLIQSGSGAITLTGTGTDNNAGDASANGWRHGLILNGDTAGRSVTVRSTSGAITLDGQASFTATRTEDSSGLQLQSNSTTSPIQVVSQTGAITLKGSNTVEETQSENALRFSASDTANNIRIGFDGTNAYSGNILIQGNSILQRTAQVGAGSIAVQSTGTLTIQSAGNSFTQLRVGDSSATVMAWGDDWNFGTSLSGFILGKSTNTSDITLANPINVAGPVNVYAGNLNLNANLTSTLSGAGILAKATGNITQAASTTVGTSGGNVTYWADSDASGNGSTLTAGGAILLDNAAAINTTGGRLVLAGGADNGANGGTAADGTPDGYAIGAAVSGIHGLHSSGTVASGVALDNASLNAGTGAVIVRGQGTGSNVNFQMGTRLYGGAITGGDVTINGIGSVGGSSSSNWGLALEGFSVTGSGAVSLTGIGGRSGAANVDINQVGVELRVAADNTSDVSNVTSTGSGALTITGTGGGGSFGTGGNAVGIRTSTNQTIQATGSGSITLDGTSGYSGRGAGIELASNVTSASGSITLQSNTSTTGTTGLSGDLTLNGNLTTGGGNVLVKAAGSINSTTARTLTTGSSSVAGGSVTLASDTDATNGGQIRMTGGLTARSYGGNITLGGGDTTASGYALGTSSAAAEGIRIQSSLVLDTTGNSSATGGDITLRGKSWSGAAGGNGSWGVGTSDSSDLTITTGTGKVLLDGVSQSTGSGFATGLWLDDANTSGNMAITSGSTAADAIKLLGSTTESAGDGVRLAYNGTNRVMATNGGVTVQGTAPTSGVRMWYADLLAGAQSVNLLSSSKLNIDGGAIWLGSRSGTSVATTSADVNVTANTHQFNGILPNVATSGGFTWQSDGTSFGAAVQSSWWTLNAIAGQTLSSLTIGKSTNTADITVSSAQSIAGPINVYGGNLAINANLTSTGVSSPILLKATGNITQAASTSVVSNAGDITYWSDSDANGGYIYVQDGSTIDSRTNADRTATNTSTASGGGAVTLGGGAGTTVPTGSAWQNTSVTVRGGIQLGTDSGSGHNSNVKVYSGGGDITLRGKATAGRADDSTGVSAYEGLTMDAGTTGNLTIDGQASGGAYSTGIMTGINGTGGSADSVLRTKDGNITLTGVSTGGSTAGNRGIIFYNNNNRTMTVAATGTGSVTLTGAGTNAKPNGDDFNFSGSSLLAASGPITINGSGPRGLTTYSGSGVTSLGFKAGSIVTSSTSNITLTDDIFTLDSGAGLQFNTTGTATVQPYGTSFTGGLSWSVSNFGLSAGLSGLTLGKAGNTSAITVASATSIAGPISLYGGNLSINAGLTATGTNTITLNASGTVTEGGSGSLSADKLVVKGGTTVTLNSSTNNVASLAASNVGNFSYRDSDALSIATVGSTSGISASGTVDVSTATGDLTVAANVTTTNTGTSAMVLNAGHSAAASTASGGNLVLSGSPALTVGSGGRATLYTGSISGSTGLGTLAGSGSGRFRYGSDEATSNFSLALSSGVHVIYRERPTVTVAVDDQTAVYSSTPTWTFSLGGGQNGDTLSQAFGALPTVAVGGTLSTAGHAVVGSHALTASGSMGTNLLGYSFAGGYTAGTLTVTPRALTVGFTGVNRAYDGSTTATVTTNDNRATGDVLSFDSSANFASKDAANGLAVSVSGVSLGGADAGNYSLSTTTGSTTANITPKALSMDGGTVVAGKVYDGNTLASISAVGNVLGLVGSETLGLTPSASFTSAAAGSGNKSATVSYALSDGSGGGLASNYSLAAETKTGLSITPKALSLTGLVVDSKTYDRSTTAQTSSYGSLSGLVGSDVVTLATSGASAAFADWNVGSNKAVTVSGLSLSGADAGNYSLAAPSSTASIFQKALTLTGLSADNKVYDASTSATVNIGGAVFGGLEAGDSGAVTITSATGAFDTKNVGNGKIVTLDTTLGGSALSNYSVTHQASTTANITPATLTLLGATSGVSKTYDGTASIAPTGVSGHGSLTGVLGSDTVALSGAAAFSGKDVARDGSNTVVASHIVQGTLALAGTDAVNYTLSWTDGSGTITPASLTVRANDEAKFVTRSDPGFSVSYSGFVAGEQAGTAGVLSTLPTVARAGAGSDEAAATYSGALVASGTLANNYDITHVAGNFTVVPADQLLVRVANTSAVYGSAPVYSISSAQYLDGNDVIHTLPSPTVVGNQYTFDDQAGGVVSFTLNPKNAVLSTAGKTTVGAYQLGANGTTFTGSNVDGLVVVGALTVDQKAVTAAATAGTTKTYDGSAAMNGLTLGLTALEANDLVSASGTGVFTDKNASAANAKSYTISNLALSGADAGNYFVWDGSSPITSLSGNGTINQATLSVNYTGVNKVYDRLDSATVTTSDNRIAGDSLSITRTATFADVDGVAGTAKNAGTGKTIDVTNVSLTGADAANYIVSSTGTATADITPKALVIAGITAQDKIYNGSNAATLDTSTTLQRSGLIAGDDVTVSATGTFASANAGDNQTVTITSVYGGDSGNYSITSQANTMASIARRQVEVSASGGISKTYDGTASMNNVSIGFAALSGVAESGVLAADSSASALSVSGQGSFSSADVSRDGSGNVLSDKGYTLSNIQLSGTAAGNYVISGGVNSVSGNNGRIDPAALTVTGNSATGTYTGQAQSVSGFTVNGLQGTDTVASLSTVSASGAMRTNAGTALNTVTAGLENNYTVTTTNGTLSITPAQLSAMLVGEVGKVYDGNLGATLAQENYVLSGWMAGEGAAVTQTTGLYADKHAGSGKQVSVNLGAGDFNAQTGTLLSNYVLPTAAEGQVGQVTPALILVGGLTAANKVYDGNTAATLDSSQAVLSGKVAGDNVALLSANGSFSDKNVGVGKTVTVTDLSLGGADAGNYRLASNTASTTADITRLGEVRWIGGPTGNWFDPANWEGGAVPDRANVAKVILPQGVTAEFDLTGYDASSAPVDLEELGKAGSLRLMNGALNIGAGGMQLDTFDQSGGVLAVNGPTQVNTLKQSGGEAQLNGGLTVLRDFEQSGAGRLRVVGDANITDTQGGVTLGALEVQGGLRLQSLDGDIRQLANTALKIGGATDLKASRGNPAVPANIDLANEGNDFIGTVSADGANISLRDSNALTLGQVDAKAGLTLRSGGTLTLGSTTVGGQLTAISDGGGIRQTGRLLVGGDTVLDAGLGDIVLENPDNVFDGRLTSRGSGLSSVKGRGVEDTSAVGGTVRQTTVGSPTANAASPSTSGPVLNEGGAPGAAPVNNGVIVEGPVRLSADVGTSTPTSPASPATTAAATGDGGSAPSSVNVMQVRAASPQTVGLVTVEVPTAQLASGFTALLPPAIANSLRTAAQVEASLPDGQPLPAWLQFDSQAMAFRSQQVPPDALPLLIALRSGAASVIVKVDQMSVQ